jgi:hypothetical protein
MALSQNQSYKYYQLIHSMKSNNNSTNLKATPAHSYTKK